MHDDMVATGRGNSRSGKFRILLQVGEIQEKSGKFMKIHIS